MIAFLFLGFCMSKVASGIITYQDIPARVAMMEYGDPSRPPVLPSFINESISMVLVADIRGIIREFDQGNGGFAIYGTWNYVLVQKLAIIAFLTGKVLPAPAKTTTIDVKYSLWFTEECMDKFNESVCNAPYSMAKFMNVLWGDALEGQNFPASKATLGAISYNVEAAQLASLKQVPQIGFSTAESPLSNKLDFPTYMRTVPSVKEISRAFASFLSKLNAYTRIDTIACDTVSERQQVAENTETFRAYGITSNYVVFFKPRRYTALPPAIMATIDFYAEGAEEEITTWAADVAGLKANNAHVHYLQAGRSCPGYDILNYLSMNKLVGAGHLWLGGDMSIMTYEQIYVQAVRYQIPHRIGLISPYGFEPALDGYIQIKPAESARQADFYTWLETLENVRTTLFEPWLLDHVPDGVFANASTTKNIFWGKPTFAFDAMWTYLLAINSLVDQTGSTDFTPQELLREAKKQRFEGLSGFVRFNETTGDRISDYMFMQYRQPSVAMPQPDCAVNTTTKQFDADLILSQCHFPPLGAEYHIATFGETLVMKSAPVFFGGSNQPPPNLNKLCQTGEKYNVLTGTCEKCPPGTYNDKPGQASCDPCRAGHFTATFGSPHCFGCLEGTIAAHAGSTSCMNCTAGTYANLAAQSTCFNCTLGQYAEIGFENCELCPKGKYQDEKGQQACKYCDAVFPGTSSDNAAISANECFCVEGTYYRPGIGCTSCDRGMECLQGKDIPRQEEGFYVEVLETGTRRYDVFECLTTDWCPAGALGTCNFPRTGRSCALVEAKKCPPWVGILFPVGMIVAMYIIYRITSNSKYGKVSATVMLAGNLGIALSAMQAVNVYVLLYDEVPKELEWLLRVAEIFMFKWQGLFPECNLGSSFFARSSLSILPPLAIAGAAALNFIITNVLRKTVLERFITRMTYGSSWNCVGIVIQVMYILQCKDAFSYFSSKPNPCGKDTLMDFTDIILWSDEHTAIGPILVTIYLWVFYVIGTYALLVYTVIIAKKRIEDRLFWEKWRFIFSRWRPECRHWGCIILLRNLCIALVPIAVPTEQLYRVFTFICILGVHAVFEAYYAPWLSNMNNAFEIGISMILCGMGVIGLGFHDSATEHQKTVASFVMMFLMACVWLALLFAVCYALLWSSPKRVKLRHKKHEDAGYALLEKAGGVLEMIHSDEDGRKRWTSFTKACSAYDKHVCIGAVHFLNDFEKADPLRRKMQSRYSVSSNCGGNERQGDTAPASSQQAPCHESDTKSATNSKMDGKEPSEENSEEVEISAV